MCEICKEIKTFASIRIQLETLNSSNVTNLLSLNSLSVVCEGDTHLRCANNDCIDKLLYCDEVKHCTRGEDEFTCPQNQGFTLDGENSSVLVVVI